MKKWEVTNPGNCNLNKLTATSIAYAVFVFESQCEVWEENIAIERMDHLDKPKKKKFAQVSTYARYQVEAV